MTFPARGFPTRQSNSNNRSIDRSLCRMQGRFCTFFHCLLSVHNSSGRRIVSLICVTLSSLFLSRLSFFFSFFFLSPFFLTYPMRKHRCKRWQPNNARRYLQLNLTHVSSRNFTLYAAVRYNFLAKSRQIKKMVKYSRTHP